MAFVISEPRNFKGTPSERRNLCVPGASLRCLRRPRQSHGVKNRPPARTPAGNGTRPAPYVCAPGDTQSHRMTVVDLSQLLCDRLYAENGRMSDVRPEAEKMLRE